MKVQFFISPEACIVKAPPCEAELLMKIQFLYSTPSRTQPAPPWDASTVGFTQLFLNTQS